MKKAGRQEAGGHMNDAFGNSLEIGAWIHPVGPAAAATLETAFFQRTVGLPLGDRGLPHP